MPDWSSHLPRLGALVLSAAVAIAAYGVYAGKSDTSVTTAGEPVDGTPSLSPKADAGVANHARPSAGERPDRHPAHGAVATPALAAVASADGPGVLAPPATVPTLQPVDRELRAPQASPVAPPNPGPGDPDDLDRELQRLIDGGPPPAAPDDQPAEGRPAPGAPVDLLDDPAPPAPADPAPPSQPQPAPEEDPQPAPTPPESETPPTTPASPATPVDDEAGLDDTPVGGLDQTDLGTPVDESDQSADAPAPPAAPAAPAAPDGPGGPVAD